MKNYYQGSYSYRKDIGRVRVTNEDQCAILTNALGDTFLVVCDGMGGQNKGDYASKLALDSLCESFQSLRKLPSFMVKNWLGKAYKKANAVIYEDSRDPTYKDMGTTAVVALIHGHALYVANAGDSRAYSYDPKEKRFQRLTQDQTYVDFLYRAGKIKESDMQTREDRHVLINALGIYPSASVDISTYRYFGESVLLCSDGLYNNLSEAEIRAVLSTSDRTDEKTASLIAEANANGGSDNIAVALWEAFPHD